MLRLGLCGAGHISTGFRAGAGASRTTQGGVLLSSLLPRAVRRHGLQAPRQPQQRTYLHMLRHQQAPAAPAQARTRLPALSHQSSLRLAPRFYATGAQSAPPPPPPPKGATSGGSGLRILALLGLTGAAAAGAVYWLGYELDDIKGLLEKPVDVEEPVVVPPVLPAPEEFVHPFDLKPWYWRYWFMFCRFVFLLYVFTPVTLSGLYLGLFHRDDHERSRKWCEWLVRKLNQAGCSMQKFGQWISMRPDMFAPELINAMSHLREHAPTHSFEITRKTFEEAIGKKIEDVFESFDPVPIASGTVAQVKRDDN